MRVGQLCPMASGTVSMKVKKISHTRLGNTGGLKLSVWATTRNGFYKNAGGTYYEISSVKKQPLKPGYSFSDVENTGKLLKRPPAGTYYIWLVLMEWNGSEYTTVSALPSSSTYIFR